MMARFLSNTAGRIIGRRGAIGLSAGLIGAALAGPNPGVAEDPFHVGIEPITEELPLYCPATHSVRYPAEDEVLPPLRLLLSRERYWAEDGHLDAVVQLNAPDGLDSNGLRVRLLDVDGRELVRTELAPLLPEPGPRFILYPRIPDALANGGAGVLEVSATLAGGERIEAQAAFRVERLPVPAEPSGRVEIRIENTDRVSATQVPFTLGVPFPRGALADARHLRLVDGTGAEVPLQVAETARWSRHGSIKWVLCDFTLDLAGAPHSLYLEYGPGIRRVEAEPIAAEHAEGFPRIEAGRLRFDQGLWFDPDGTGAFVRVLDEAALSGAFVVREDGRRYRTPIRDRFEIEEQGPRKLVLRREGWYEGTDEGDRFCLYTTRYVIHRDSPLVRILHTWVFTGDGNRERIANMGWSFPLADGMDGTGFLVESPDAETWTEGTRLLQHDYDHLALFDGDAVEEHPGGRAPGIVRAEGEEARLTFGVRDFWQNYPSELEFDDGALWFHNWPRRNRPAGYAFAGDLVTTPGEPALPSAARHAQVEEGRMTRSEWKLNVVQARFAHEGELLDFRLPDILAEDPIWQRSSAGRVGSTYWIKGEPETANAQGISRTEEMWLLLSPAGNDPAADARLLRGLNEETVRAVADPAWVAASGAFYEIHPRDTEQFAEDERVFEEIALAPGRWIERLGLYGMWIFGDIAAWNPALARREPSLYRAFRKRHQGWPYSWVPFARSGDPRLLRLADAATRRNIDAHYCHYVTDDVAAQAGSGRYRRRGRWHRSTLPWASRTGPTSRCYESQTDFLWHAWYLTGYHRALDHIRDWAVETKHEEDLPLRGPIRIGGSNRLSITMQKSYLDMYEGTFDPWFLVAAHALADGHLNHFHTRRYSIHGAGDNATGASHFWRTGDRDYLRFTDREDYRAFYLAYADFWGSHTEQPSWTRYGAPMIEPNVHAWRLTGRDYYLRRVAAYLDWPRVSVIDAEEPDYYRGHMSSGQVALSTGWYLQFFPLALAAFDEAGARPVPVFDSFIEQAQSVTGEDAGSRFQAPVILLRKEEGEPLPLSFAGLAIPLRSREDEVYDFRVTAPDGETVLSGSWRLRERAEMVIPAEAPGGIYRLAVSGATRRGIEVPVSLPGTPEILAWDPGTPASPSGTGQKVQYWFFVPNGVPDFHVEIPPTNRGLRRISIWDPDGGLAWDRQSGLGEDENPLQIHVKVEPGQAGRLWRITLPGGGGFVLDPRIPPVLAVNPERWFLPEAFAEAEHGNP